MAKKSKRHGVRRRSKYLVLGFLASIFSIHAKSEDNRSNAQKDDKRFSWNENRKLSWNDFKGPVVTQNDESAAATCCSIGLTVDNDAAGEPVINVYNSFYINKSWVKEDARIESVLVHEQGHFDLCELYTRKLRTRVATIDLKSATAKEDLMNIYSALSDEYETRQQAYEQETAHGTIIHEQERWKEMIGNELGLFQ